jgi:AraC-like DNA-binding protein
MVRLLFTIFLTINFVAVIAQDSLFSQTQNLLSNHPQQDTIRVNLLNELSYDYRWIDFCQSQQYADEALKISRQLSFARGTAIANSRIAHCSWALGDNELAIEKALEAAAISEREHFESALGESYHVLSRAYLDQRETDKSVLYILKAEKIAVQSKDWDLLSRVYNWRGVILLIKKQNDSALVFFNKALSTVQQHSTSKAQLSQIISNIGECYVENNRELGLTYFKNALTIARTRETLNKSADAAISGIIGHTLIKKGNYKDAEEYLLQALKLARQLGSRRSIRYDYSGLVDLKVREGKSSEALSYLKKYYEVHDSLLNVAKTRQIVELESKYELEKKEHAIQLLKRDKEIQLLWANILITVLVFVGILSAALYYLQEFRDRKNRMILNLEIDRLTTKNTELSEKFKDVLASADAKVIESSDQRLLKKAIEIVESNMKDPSFSVEQMSKELGMSRTNMNRKIKALTGFPPSELIRNIRLRRAASLLLSKADSVSQISFTVGFEDHSYFSKSFKKQFGVAPSEYAQSKERMN